MVAEGDVTLGDEHTMHHADDVVQGCTPETYHLITHCHPKKLMRKMHA